MKFLASSPLLASWEQLTWALMNQRTTAGQVLAVPPAVEPVPETDGLITSAADAINVFDFEKVARHNLPPAHYGYLATGVDDNATLRANREAFAKIQIRARRLIDVRNTDPSIELFGEKWETPIIIAPTGSQRAFHPDGEVATANAARTRNHLQILSTVTTTSVEDVTKARGAPVWFQLYPRLNWQFTRGLVQRAEASGCPVVVITVDLPTRRNTETLQRFTRLDARVCTACHTPGPQGVSERKPMLDGLEVATVEATSGFREGLTWDFIRRVQDATSMKVLIKGIVTREDAQLCLDYGVDGIIVSNHGGRALESGRATIDCLAEVVAVVDEQIPVLIDSGFRRGTDIFKALALGAQAICIGRPYLWGLAAFGQPGVETVLDILRAELVRTMKMAGVTSLAQFNRSFVTVEPRGSSQSHLVPRTPARHYVASVPFCRARMNAEVKRVT